MNQAQLQGMRELHESTKTVLKKKMSAVEMALTSHNLSKNGDLAYCEDGTYIWDNKFQHWAFWKAARC